MTKIKSFCPPMIVSWKKLTAIALISIAGMGISVAEEGDPPPTSPSSDPNQPPDFTVTVDGPTDVGLNAGSCTYTANPVGGKPGYTYSWSVSAGSGTSTSKSVSASGVQLGAQWLKVTVTDSDGKSEEVQHDVTVHEKIEVIPGGSSDSPVGTWAYIGAHSNLAYDGEPDSKKLSVTKTFSTTIGVTSSAEVKASVIAAKLETTVSATIEISQSDSVTVSVPPRTKVRVKGRNTVSINNGTVKEWDGCGLVSSGSYTDRQAAYLETAKDAPESL